MVCGSTNTCKSTGNRRLNWLSAVFTEDLLVKDNANLIVMMIRCKFDLGSS